jgi:hypothetical protein
MFGMKRSGFIGALGTVALAAALLPGSAAGSDSAPVVTGGGVLRLHMGADGDNVRFQPATGSGEAAAQQTITNTKCVVTLKPADTLVTFQSVPVPPAPAGAVGFFDHGLGVKGAADGTGTPCGRVDGTTQRLRIALGTSLTNAKKRIEFAELDIEGKFNVIVHADAYLGPNVVGTASLPTGTNSDSGPDSGDGDNYRWLIHPATPFDRLELSVDPTTPGGSFSLEGGADGTAPLSPAPGSPPSLGQTLNTSDSLFQLTDGLDCGQSSGDVGGNGTPTANLTRGQNANCQLIPYLLRTGIDSEQFVLLQKNLGTQTNANFLMDIAWQPEHAPIGPVPVTTIDYGNGPVAVIWCTGTVTAPVLPPGGQHWCLVSHHVELAGSVNVQVTERYFGSGDPRWAR